MATSKCPPSAWALAEGIPSPLGASWNEQARAWNFALYSKHATSVTLLLYKADQVGEPARRVRFDPLANKSGRIWHCWVPEAELQGAVYYAYSVDGPREPWAGLRFDPDKVLLDPYARAIYFPPAFDREAARRPGSNAGRAPLGVLEASRHADGWTDCCRPHHAWDTVIYEMHVRGFTRRANSGVPVERRGTFAGVIDKIPYLLDLGVTVVELLPVFQRDPQERNYWGYMPLNFFAPHVQYAAAGTPEGAIDEMREMVGALHEAGIEIVLDVVYNHTVEGNDKGPTYSYRGIDNLAYYLMQVDRSQYRNDAGTGNVLHTANMAVRKMVVDSMRFWAREMHVDGFRFDLASIFTRRTDGSIDLHDPPMISSINADPDFRDLRLIAEAWDLESYQLGRRFPGVGWYQWNDRFRDEVRAFVRGDRGTVGNLMTRLYGSADQFPDGLLDAYHAYQSVNFVTAHDGFCLYDLVSYNEKHNLANGEGNADGAEEERQLELRPRRRRGGAARGSRAAPSAGEELLRAAVPVQRHADAPLGRRVHADAGRQQQPLQPGQRDDVARLVGARAERGRLPVLQGDDRVPQGAPVDRTEPVLARRCLLVRRGPRRGLGRRVAAARLLPARGVAGGPRPVRDAQRRRRGPEVQGAGGTRVRVGARRGHRAALAAGLRVRGPGRPAEVARLHGPRSFGGGARPRARHDAAQTDRVVVSGQWSVVSVPAQEALGTNEAGPSVATRSRSA